MQLQFRFTHPKISSAMIASIVWHAGGDGLLISIQIVMKLWKCHIYKGDVIILAPSVVTI